MKLKHPESGQTIEVTDEFVENYETQGWEQVGKKSTASDD